MKPFVYRITFVLSLLTLGYLSGYSTTLGLGDIAITDYNSDNNNTNDRDEFVFVLLKDLSGPMINTASNWSTSDATSASLPLNRNINFCTPGEVNSINGSPGPLCPSSTQTLSVPAQASLNDDQTWEWYTGSCGGTHVNTGPNFNVSPTVTTTYYVRAEGTCSGTSGACASLTIVVEDTVDPEVTCPADINVNNDPGQCSAVVNFTATGTDNCGGTVDITYSQNPGTVFPRGTTLVNVTATDDIGNTDNCSFNVTVNDTEAPIAKCPGVIFDVELDLMGNGILPANIGDGNSTDNCGSIETSPELSFTCDDVGVQTVTLTANDLSGGISTIDCSFNVVDNVGACCTPGEVNSINGSPGPLCPSSTQTLSVNGSLNDDQTWEWYTGSCGGTHVHTGPNFNVSPTVTTTYYVRAEGTCSGTSGACASFTIVVEDTVDPEVTCPADINVNNDPGQCSAVVNFTATGTDNCGGFVGITYSQDPGTAFNVGTTQVDVTATDDFGNSTNCSFDVTVTDNEGPTGTCNNMSLDLAANGQVTFNVFVAGGLTNRSDNCGLSNSVGVTGPTLFTCADLGARSVTIFNRDINGNETPCTVILTINDPLGVCNQPPVANCKSITVSVAPNTCEASITPQDVDDGSSDPDNDPLTLSLDNSGPFGPGTHTVELTVSDGNLSDKCTAMVTVKDNQDPVIACPGDITVNSDPGQCGAVVNYSVSFGDNCPSATLILNPASESFFGVGSKQVDATVTDPAGNTDQCSFNVIVNDNEVPSFSNCPGNINLFNDPGDCGAIASWTPPTLEDNCLGATADSFYDPGDFFPVGTTTVTYTGTDAAGNDATDCSFTVSVTDIEEPIIACPANISTGTDPGECGAQVTFTAAIANDNCAVEEVKARYRPVDENNSPIGDWTDRVFDPSGYFPVGRYQVAWRAKDIYGNKRTCFQYLEVYDDEAPMAVCKDLTVDFNGEKEIILTANQVWNEGASSDNCGAVAFVSADLSISCEALGSTVAIPVTIEDGAGNENECTAYVDVIGLPCGWSEGPHDGSLNCDGQTTSDYEVAEESFTLTSDGCWHDCREEDRATYVYHPLCGDGTLTAKLASINTGGYAGLMARESLDPWARRAGVLKNFSTRRVRREWRASYGGIVSQSQSNRSRVKWLRLVRKGNVIKSYTSTNGSYWRLLYKVTFSNLEDCIYVGMTAYSTNGGALVNAVFENVSLSGNGSLAAGLPDQDTVPTPDGLHAWGTVGNVGNGTIAVYPNPASNQAQIVLDGFADQSAKLVVRDAFGKEVRRIDLDSAMGVTMSLEIQDLAAGVYTLSVVQDARLVVTKKLIVQP